MDSTTSQSLNPNKPLVKRTYGKVTRNPSSTSTYSASLLVSWSPPSSPLRTPHASSPGIAEDVLVKPSSPLHNINRDHEKENAPDPFKPTISRSVPTQSSLRGFFTTSHAQRPLAALTPNVSSTRLTPSSSTDKGKGKPALTQLHLTHLPLLHTCPQCHMSFVRGGEDESVHERHHARVVKGIIWEGMGRSKRPGKGVGKGKERDMTDCGWKVVRDGVELGHGKVKARIIMMDSSWGGSKLHDILSTVDTVLSSPPLSAPILKRCKVFVFLTSSPAPTRHRAKRQKPYPEAKHVVAKERVVGVAVAQSIKVAMRVLREGETGDRGEVVDSGDGVFCDPEPLPTPLGIHRLFTIPTYRFLGIAQLLLDAACQHTIYGCRFDPFKSEVAFSQPTNSGRAVMEKWGQGRVRVFVDDERQL